MPAGRDPAGLSYKKPNAVFTLIQRAVEEALIHDNLNVVVVDWVGGKFCMKPKRKSGPFNRKSN